MAAGVDTPAAAQARRLAGVLTELAKAPPAAKQEVERVLVAPLRTTLQQVRDLFSAEPVTLDSLPPDLKSAWVAPDGEVRIEVAPKGDANDNRVLRRFVEAVRKAAPQASGTPIFIVEAAATIVKAFLQAAAWSLVSIALILFIVLRRWTDVALTLVPLLVAIVATLEICVAIGLQLNFANIIALPLLLGVGVAFKIYYVMAWRAGENELSAVAADAGGSVQRLHHGDRLRQSLVFPSSGDVEHGETDGAVAGDDALGRRAVPARASGDPGKTQAKRRDQGRWNVCRVWQNGDSRVSLSLLA